MPRAPAETILYSLKFSLNSTGDIISDTEGIDPTEFVRLMNEMFPDYPHTNTIASFIRSAKELGEDVLEKLDRQLAVT